MRLSDIDKQHTNSVRGQKISETIDLTPRRTIRQSHEEIEDTLQAQLKQLGKSGVYGSAYKVPGAMQTALKVGQTDQSHVITSPEDDGYLQWIKRCYGRQNPFLPQVIKAKVFRAPKDDRFQYHVRMERLVLPAQISEAEAYDLLIRYFGYRFTNADIARFQKEAARYHTSLKAQYLRWFARTLSLIVANRSSDVDITDENLLEAIHMMREMVNEGYTLDLHEDNIAFRRTRYGLQPVILDPFNERAIMTH